MTAIPPQLVGDSSAFHSLLDWVSALASLDKPVLIEGARGTGKTLLAPRLHFLSPRWEQTFVSLDCAGYDAGEQTEILFGPNNLTDISGGAIERAEGGTLFLDNIEYLSPELQARLAPMLDFGAVSLPGRGAANLNIRLLAARRVGDLPVDKRRYGLSSFLADSLVFEKVIIPPLRERPQDIQALARHFGRKMAAALGGASFLGLSAELQTRLETYDWPGNVRELKTVIERAVTRAFFADEDLKTPIEAAPFYTGILPDGSSGRDKLQNQDHTKLTGQGITHDRLSDDSGAHDFTFRIFTFERRLIDEALSRSSHHQGRAASYLGLTYHQFRGLLRKHGLKK